MALDKLEFKIIKEADGSDIDLSKLSLKATESLIILLESMKTIISNTPGGEDVKIQVIKGSARVITEAPEEIISSVLDGYERVITKSETNADIVAPWRQLQNLFQANGLVYDAFFTTKTHTRSLEKEIKKSKEFRAKPIKRYSTFHLEFIKGKLIEVGGKKPNIHLSDRSPIRCTENDAIAVNKFLYQNIELLIRRQAREDEEELTFCGFFPVEGHQLYFLDLVEQYHNLPLDNFLEYIHYKLKDLLDKKDFGMVKKIFRIFDHLSVDVNIFKTILIITKSFAKNPELKDIRGKFYHTLKNKLDRE